MSAHHHQSVPMKASGTKNVEVLPRRYEPSVSPETGSLLMAPLSTVLHAATDGLYSDLYSMVNGEMEIISSSTAAAPAAAPSGTYSSQQEEEDNANNNNANNNNATSSAMVTSSVHGGCTRRKEKMSSLPFAQRRHELGWRLAQHTKGFYHIAALTAAYLAGDASRLEKVVKVANEALSQTHTAWVKADEAQDALYFHHADLWKARAHHHDVLGALELLLGGQWRELPSDLRLRVDRYDGSAEQKWTKKELVDKWTSAVQEKLISGEVGWRRRQELTMVEPPINGNATEDKCPWRVSLNGGVVRLTHGIPKHKFGALAGGAGDGEDGSRKIYPVEARLTVLSERPHAAWTLLSVDVHVSAKTGESSHQLDMTNPQRYHLHRLCTASMAAEEARAAAQRDELEKEVKKKTDDTIMMIIDDEGTPPPPQPLDCLFEVAHTFAISLQLEILSAQAEALRKGLWGGAGGDSHREACISVSPVQFLQDDEIASGKTHDDEETLVGQMAIHFWSIDDRYGPPQVADLRIIPHSDHYKKGKQQTSSLDNDTISVTSSIHSSSTLRTAAGAKANKQMQAAAAGRLTLCIKAFKRIGMVVSLSGKDNLLREELLSSVGDGASGTACVKRNVEKLLQATCNPFELSASDALLAATVICGERRSLAAVDALRQQGRAATTKDVSSSGTTSESLPPWLHLYAERGSIVVAVQISYCNGVADETGTSVSSRPFVELFRLSCDSRTGSFVAVFPRSSRLLRLLACNSHEASELQALRTAKFLQLRRSAAAIGKEMTGRNVKDAFDGLTRSMGVLGRRVGVGGEWDDSQNTSAKLRERAIHLACADVRTSLMTCCGMAALYGFSAVALGIGTGIDAQVDMAGGPISQDNGHKLLPTGPLSIVLDQHMVEEEKIFNGDEKRKVSLVKRDLFAMSCSVTDHHVHLHCFDVQTIVDSPIAVPTRTACQLIPLRKANPDMLLKEEQVEEPPLKKAKLEENGGTNSVDLDHTIKRTTVSMVKEAEHLALMIMATLDED